MAIEPDPVAVKRKLSPVLLEIEGVSGLGLPGGRLTVYLVADRAETRRRVQEAAAKVAPGTKLAFEVTGHFEAH
ncbi:MAG TPA: hypothetical protein VF530_16735 [Planctomycetota bacterium]